MKAGTNLEKVLASGQFAVTAEAGPPRGASAASVQKKGELLRHCCDAVNVTDNQTAIVRMSSLAGCVILKEQGIDAGAHFIIGLPGDTRESIRKTADLAIELDPVYASFNLAMPRLQWRIIRLRMGVSFTLHPPGIHHISYQSQNLQQQSP